VACQSALTLISSYLHAKLPGTGRSSGNRNDTGTEATLTNTIANKPGRHQQAWQLLHALFALAEFYG